MVSPGDAVQVRDDARLRRVADRYAAKYDPPFHFKVREGAFYGEGGNVLVFEVAPTEVFAFGKGKPFSQTRWRF